MRFFMGEWGILLRKDANNSIAAEKIGDKGLAPIKLGPLRIIQSFRSGIFATGTGRQVYRRNDDSSWSLFSSSIIYWKAQAVMGFNTIIETNDGIYTAGYSGEIFFHDGSNWTKIASPANVLLNRGMSHQDKIFLFGIDGIALCGTLDTWSVLDMGDFENAFGTASNSAKKPSWERRRDYLFCEATRPRP